MEWSRYLTFGVHHERSTFISSVAALSVSSVSSSAAAAVVVVAVAGSAPLEVS